MWEAYHFSLIIVCVLVVIFRRIELKKATEIFTRMFHDPHSKVSKIEKLLNEI